MTSIERLMLSYDGAEVASVERTAEDFTSLALTYTDSWRSRADAFPISLRFPLDVAHHEGPDVYIWLMNLLPEDETLKIVGALLDISDIDVLGLVARMGGDLPGALVAHNVETPQRKRQPRYHEWTDAELAAAIRSLPERPLLAGEEGVEMSLAGQQNKLPVFQLHDGRLALPLDGHPSTYILKPASKRLPASVENEAFCLKLAVACGLNAAAVSIGQVEDLKYLLVRRYDRRIERDKVVRLHQEDLCQSLGYPPYRKYEWNGRIRQRGPSAADFFTAVSQGHRTLPNRLALLDMVIFNIVCCNVDSHAKNYSILLADRDGPIVAPLYDVMCGEIYPDVTTNLPQKIAGKNRGNYLEARHWDQFAREMGIAGPQVIRRVRRICESVEAHADAIADVIGRSPLLDEIAAIVTKRSRALMAGLK